MGLALPKMALIGTDFLRQSTTPHNAGDYQTIRAQKEAELLEIIRNEIENPEFPPNLSCLEARVSFSMKDDEMKDPETKPESQVTTQFVSSCEVCEENLLKRESSQSLGNDHWIDACLRLENDKLAFCSESDPRMDSDTRKKFDIMLKQDEQSKEDSEAQSEEEDAEEEEEDVEEEEDDENDEIPKEITDSKIGENYVLPYISQSHPSFFTQQSQVETCPIDQRCGDKCCTLEEQCVDYHSSEHRRLPEALFTCVPKPSDQLKESQDISDVEREEKEIDKQKENETEIKTEITDEFKTSMEEEINKSDLSDGNNKEQGKVSDESISEITDQKENETEEIELEITDEPQTIMGEKTEETDGLKSAKGVYVEKQIESGSDLSERNSDMGKEDVSKNGIMTVIKNLVDNPRFDDNLKCLFIHVTNHTMETTSSNALLDIDVQLHIKAKYMKDCKMCRKEHKEKRRLETQVKNFSDLRKCLPKGSEKTFSKEIEDWMMKNSEHGSKKTNELTDTKDNLEVRNFIRRK